MEHLKDMPKVALRVMVMAPKLEHEMVTTRVQLMEKLRAMRKATAMEWMTVRHLDL